jgi:tRNA modification GTPase
MPHTIFDDARTSASRVVDTIAALATPPGQGGIGVLRVSGALAKPIGQRLFRSSNPDFTDFKPYRLHHGRLVEYSEAPEKSPRVLDELLLAFMPGPRSYTGEDVVEFHCHGGPAILAAGLEAILRCGARLAERGEFTKRAFLNGRLDLTQAEAVAEAIAATSRPGLHLAQEKLQGRLGETVRELRVGLERLRQALCLALDFPEDEVECLAPEDLASGVRQTLERIRGLLANYRRLRCWREGGLAALVGRVNVGKSSLLNALLGWRRAIVTDIPGTTRDFIEESLILDGLPVRVADTAGLRDSDDPVEQEGVLRGRELMAQADLTLFVLDAGALANSGLDAEERRLAETLDPSTTLLVLNKRDLLPDPAPPLPNALEHFTGIAVSAKNGLGLDALTASIRERLAGQADPETHALAPNLRQSQALERAALELQALLDEHAFTPYDLLSVRLETACVALAEITGDIASEDVLNSVFESFCIGK